VKFFSCAVCFSLTLLMLALAGCGTSYAWRRSTVPSDMRTVCVPTFGNESELPELGSIASRQILREFQREGTFKIRASGDAVIEIQGVIKSAIPGRAANNRQTGSRKTAYNFRAEAEVSVIDKRSRKVLVDNKRIVAETVFSSGGDFATAKRDASGRLMDDLARQVVDCVLGIKW